MSQDRICDNCEEVQADVQCRECNEYFCSECNIELHAPQKLQAHTRKPFQQQVASDSAGLRAQAERDRKNQLAVLQQKLKRPRKRQASRNKAGASKREVLKPDKRIDFNAGGVEISVFECDQVSGYGGTLWWQAKGLTRFILTEKANDWSGVRVLELGCGLGLVAVAAAKRGAVVCATDRQMEALDLAQYNATKNDVKYETAPLDWAGFLKTDSRETQWIKGKRFDVVLGAAVIYHISMIEPLARTIRAALISSSSRPPSPAQDTKAQRRGIKVGDAGWCQFPIAVITIGFEKTREDMFKDTASKLGLECRTGVVDFSLKKGTDKPCEDPLRVFTLRLSR